MKRPTSDRARPGEPADARDLLWPLLITFGLLIVVLVNAAFIWIAVDGRDPVVDSYVTEPR